MALGVLATILPQQLGGEQKSNQQQTQNTAPVSANTVIYLPTRITNAFSLAGEVLQRRAGGTLELLIYQGANRTAGYDLKFPEAGNCHSFVELANRQASLQRADRS